jgi:mannose-6-phosphate isomerase
MRIAMVCPLDAVVSPTAEGSPHRAIGELAAALVAGGHHVTLFAAEGSSGGSDLVPCPGQSGKDQCLTPRLQESFQLGGVLDAFKEYELVHNHAGVPAAVLLSRGDLALLTTIHRACSAEDVDALQRLGDGVCLAGGAPGLIPDHLPLMGTLLPGPQMADECLDLYRQVLDRRENYRPWGHYVVLEDNPRHKVKRIVVNPGQRLSLQLHHQRAEHWLVIEGEGLVTLDDDEILVCTGEDINIPREARHRIRNQGSVPCVFIEVQTGEYFGEDDIVRFEDDYGRSS